VKFALLSGSAALLLILPLLFAGVLNRTKAFWAGRKGASLLQPLFDFARLLGKESVTGETVSPIFRIGSALGLAAAAAAGLFVPFLSDRAFLSFEGDILVFAGFLGLSRFCLTLSALDTGSSFEGMGASREIVFSAVIEPALLLCATSFIYLTGQTSLSGLLRAPSVMSGSDILTALLGALAWFLLLLAEGTRMPVDDPTTHLELTMVHEVMILDHSGPDLAFQTFAARLKMVWFGLLIAAVLLPQGLSLPVSLAAILLVLLAVAILTGSVESFTARLRMSHVPQFLLFIAALGLLLFFSVLTGRGGS
jgi:formate hydrogenlyase subunit 4